MSLPNTMSRCPVTRLMRLVNWMSLRYWQVLLLSLLVLCGLLLNTASHAATDADGLRGQIDFTRGAYRVGPGDVLGMQVYHQPDFTQNEILIREDGYAGFSNVGDVFVAGKTADEIAQELRSRVGDLVIDPIVTITISQTRPGTVYLAGAVMHPGMYQMVTSTAGKSTVGTSQGVSRMDLRLSNILANAGGVALDADLTHVQVRRPDTGETRTVNLWQVLKNGNRDQDILVQSGDTISVPQLKAGVIADADYQLLLKSAIGPGTFPIRVLGEVGTPGVYDLAGSSPYLASALAKAGGYKSASNRKLIAVRRFTDTTHYQTFTLNPNDTDVMLRPNDVVYVPETRIGAAGRVMENVAKILSPFTAVTSTIFNASYVTGIGGPRRN